MKIKFLIFFCPFLVFPLAYGEIPKSQKPPSTFSKNDFLSVVVDDSFSHRDHAGSTGITDYNLKAKRDKTLSEYKGLNDFFRPRKKLDHVFPWRNGPFTIEGKKVAKLNLENKKHARLFSQLVYKYILEGWFSSERGLAILNFDEHFRDNHERTWCTTPGVVDGEGGREAVHGLTKELGLKPNPLFPSGRGQKNFTESLWEPSQQPNRPAGWGQPFYNAVVCDKYQKIFGSVADKRLPKMSEQRLLENEAGFVSFKLHFNAMKDWQQYKPFTGAYTWTANVGSTSGDPLRQLQKIPLIQISVSMKLDPHYIDGLDLKGGEKKADNWVMLAYYHDANYSGSVSNIPHLPASLQKMRPMGVQTGFSPADTIIFAGSKSNYKMNKVDAGGNITGHIWHPNDSKTLLNGPADNAYSSCLGCHAGFSYMDVLSAKDPKRGGADILSFYNVKTFEQVRKDYGKREDFNLQLFNAFQKVKAWIEL